MKFSFGHVLTSWFAVAALFVAMLSSGTAQAENTQIRAHHVALQVNSDDPVAMKHAVSNSMNLIRNYRENGEPIQIEIVAYGPGIAMFRSDISPVREILDYIHSNIPEISFTMCGSTKAIIEKREGHKLPLIEGTQVVPFGIVRLVELQETGWSYIRP
ncbi:MAG: hypothetical protein AB7M05_08360 [Alphaproteobacteria bacterium]